ncbi:isochorismatase family protein [Kribbella antibiotica]|uniref:Isochorismatase family protein n=1 Tax=Kribbella antibiotica TaxID=190195 RepID=A0A4R4ZWP8_9ACTN|nr:isochorismatase family protein [Kribbella antibiotica]TDD62704.1 isochorismatase family protein [Kribbella antibiotica]
MTQGIAPIASYPMPGEADLPLSRVDWQPDPARSVLLLHDLQEYFLRPFEPTAEPRSAMVPNLVRVRETCAQLGVPVVYTAQPGSMTPAERGLLKAFWGNGMTADAADRQVIPELAPRPGDHELVKWRYSAFHKTGLLDLLRSTGRDQLLIGGVYAHLGCLVSTIDAYSNDIETFLIADGLADFDRERHEHALTYAAASCAAVRSTDQLLAAFDRTVMVSHE